MRKKYIIGLIVIAGAFLYLVWTSFNASFQFALTPSEFLSSLSQYADKSVKISGEVEENSLRASGSDYYFKVTDGKQALNVHYNGVAPNTFRECGSVIVNGRFNSATNVFEATELIAKCASKYKAR